MCPGDLHTDEADWRPLEAILPPADCHAFMYVGWLEIDGQRLHHYKHIDTRRYLFVTDGLKAYRYFGDDYLPQAMKLAIQHVLELDERWRGPPAEGMLAYHEEDNGEASR